jgi:hypothetical protein
MLGLQDINTLDMTSDLVATVWKVLFNSNPLEAEQRKEKSVGWINNLQTDINRQGPNLTERSRVIRAIFVVRVAFRPYIMIQ